MRKSPLAIVLLTVFIDLIGFGIVIPLLPIYADSFGATGWVIGAIMAAYSAMQFVFSPILGRLSDRVGRRPILLLSQFGAAASYAAFAYGSGMSDASLALWILFISRALGGVFGANIAVAQAAIADVTPPEKRTKRMGLVGLAFGLGFIFGPAIGAFASGFGASAPGWVAAALCGSNFLLAYFILPETRKMSEAAPSVGRRGWFDHWTLTMKTPGVGTLVGLFFVATFCFTAFETTLGLLIIRNLELDAESARQTSGYLFAYAGLIGALIQGWISGGSLVKRVGEKNLLTGGLALVSISLFMLPGARAMGGLLGALAILAVGSSVVRPPIFGLISRWTSEREQGANIGVAQSSASLARVIGPIIAATLFSSAAGAPYWLCGSIAGIAAIASIPLLRKDPTDANRPEVESGA